MDTTTDKIAAAEAAMEMEADVRVQLRGEYRHPSGSGFHRHVALEWEGGVLWLDMSVQSDHYCIDVRQFVPNDLGRPDVHLAGQGVFGMVNGRRQTLALETTSGRHAPTGPLLDPDGTPVLGHGWNASYVVTLMHDKEPSGKQTNRPAGSGRG